MFVARQNIHTQNEAQVGNHVTVVGVRRTAGFLRIVPDNRTLLLAIDWLHCGIRVQYPIFLHHRVQGEGQVMFEPGFCVLRINWLKGAAHRIVATDLAHSQKTRVDAIMPECVHMRIATATRYNRQNKCA